MSEQAETYCLGLIVEEKDEVGQLIGKAIRFGLDTPGVKRLDGTVDMEQTPRTMLAVELGDLLAAIDFARDHGLFDRSAIAAAHERKYRKLRDATALDNLGRPLAPQPATPRPPSQHREPIEADREAELIRRLVLPMVAERSREPMDAWDQAHRALSSLAFSTPAASDAEALRPHIEKLRRCAPINDDMGRVVNGQTEAMREIVRWFDALPLPKAGEMEA